MNFQVELTSYCNLTCGYCPNKGMKRKRAFMSDEIWTRILFDYIIPYKDKNSFCPPTFIGHKDGEPLLSKKLPDRLIDVSNMCPDMHIDIYSHGLMLPKWEKGRRDFFQFLSTLSNPVRYMMSYHPYNHDNSINNYEPVVTYLKKMFHSSGLPRNVEFITVSHKSKWVSEDMQQAWKQTWLGYPITVHCNVHINPWTGRIKEEGTTKFNGCPYGDFGHWFFGATGNIIACCLDLEEEIIIGNVLEDNPSDMFEQTSKFYEVQRETQRLKQRPLNAVCDNCFNYDRNDREPKQMLQLGRSILT